MIDEEYEKLRQAEDHHWWFVSLHRFIIQFIPVDCGKQESIRALDIGCGTGRFLQIMKERGYCVTGIDYSPRSVQFSARRGIDALIQGSANQLPLAENSFDLVTCIDVLEVGSVIPEMVITEALRMLKPGGFAVFVAAAHDWLLSEHDRAVNSVRRFSLKDLRGLINAMDGEIIYSSYLFFLLFPLIAGWKLVNRPRPSTQGTPAISDVREFNPVLGKILGTLCAFESILYPRFSAPIGSSALMVIRKTGRF